MLESLKKIIERVFPDVDTAQISEDTNLVDDLDFDSLSIMMMSMEIEAEFGFKFTEFVKFDTVGDVCKYIEEKTGE